MCLCNAHSFHLHAIHDERLIVRSLSVSSCLSFSCFSLLFTSSLFYPTCTLTCTPSSLSTAPRETTAALSPSEEYCTLAIYHPRTGYEPNVLDDFLLDTKPSYLCDAELDEETIRKALSSPLFIQEREEPVDRRQAYHSHEESFLSAQSFFAHARTGRPVHELSSCQKRKSSREMENERIRILLERQKEQILSEVRTEIQKHEFQADSDRRSIQELIGIIESQRREIDHTIAGDEQLRRDQQLLHEHLSEQNRDPREAQRKSLYEMEKLKRVQE